jgi:hypothetical protein
MSRRSHTADYVNDGWRAAYGAARHFRIAISVLA